MNKYFKTRCFLVFLLLSVFGVRAKERVHSVEFFDNLAKSNVKNVPKTKLWNFNF